jgi:hypothetical protein
MVVGWLRTHLSIRMRAWSRLCPPLPLPLPLHAVLLPATHISTHATQSDANVHLLKLYESGLPAWAVVLPSYGLWYRPWLRRVVRALWWCAPGGAGTG